MRIRLGSFARRKVYFLLNSLCLDAKKLSNLSDQRTDPAHKNILVFNLSGVWAASRIYFSVRGAAKPKPAQGLGMTG